MSARGLGAGALWGRRRAGLALRPPPAALNSEGSARRSDLRRMRSSNQRTGEYLVRRARPTLPEHHAPPTRETPDGFPEFFVAVGGPPGFGHGWTSRAGRRRAVTSLWALPAFRRPSCVPPAPCATSPPRPACSSPRRAAPGAPGLRSGGTGSPESSCPHAASSLRNRARVVAEHRRIS